MTILSLVRIVQLVLRLTEMQKGSRRRVAKTISTRHKLPLSPERGAHT
jgi:hypothetical protein